MEQAGAATKPTIVLLHGAYHRKEHLYLLEEALSDAAFDAVAVDLPVDDPTLTQEDDARIVADAAQGIDNVMVVAHCRSGDFLLSAMQRMRASRRTGVFLCASGFGLRLPPNLPPRNTAHFTDGIKPHLDGLTTYHFWRARTYFYPYHPDDETAAEWRLHRDRAVKMLRPQRPRNPGQAPLLEEVPDGIDLYSIYGSRDAAVNPQWSAAAAEALGIPSIAIPDGHSPFLANPRRLAGILADLALRTPDTSAAHQPLPKPRIPADQSKPKPVPRGLPPRATPGRYTYEELKAMAAHL